MSFALGVQTRPIAYFLSVSVSEREPGHKYEANIRKLEAMAVETERTSR